MATFIYPNSALLDNVTAIQLDYKTGLVKLLKSAIVLTPDLDAAACAAAEADFSGYLAHTYTTLPAPFLDQNHDGVSFTCTTADFATADPTTVGNDIYGGWVEDAGGDLLVAFLFSTSYPMNAPHDQIPLELTLNYFGDGSFIATIGGVPY